jgi:uncharacterized membrane protein
MNIELLHPPIVHFAIALTITGVIFEILYLITKKESFKNAGFWTFIFGAVSVVLAALTGHLAEEAVEDIARGVAHDILETHEELGNILAGLFVFLGAFRIFVYIKDNMKLYYLYLVAAIVSVLLIAYQGNLGGKLVYEHGVIPNVKLFNEKDMKASEEFEKHMYKEEHEEEEEDED